MYKVVLGRPARRFYDRADAALQRRLDDAFKALGTEPRAQPGVRRLAGRFDGFYRYRVGDYRVVYSVEEDAKTVSVAAIGHRREIYR